jgi:hypothetical protein
VLAKSVLDDEKNVLAKGVLDGGVFAMRKAEELAEAVLGETRDEEWAGEEPEPAGTITNPKG